MAQEPRFALRQFIAAVEKHFEAVAAKRGPEDLSVEQSYWQLQDAFLDYQEAMGETFEEDLPFDLPEESEED